MPIAKSPTQGKKTGLSVVIDYPVEQEKIMPGHYAVRISAVNAERVEVSFNKGDWQVCRFADGYFWFDWWPAGSGKVVITARAQSGKSRSKKSEERSCFIISPNSN